MWLDSSDPSKAGKYILKVKYVDHNHDFSPVNLGTLGPNNKFTLAAKQLIRDSPGAKGVQLAVLIRDRVGVTVTPKETCGSVSVERVVSDVDVDKKTWCMTVYSLCKMQM